MMVSVLVVAAVVILCLGLVWLLPRTAPPDGLEFETMGDSAGVGP